MISRIINIFSGFIVDFSYFLNSLDELSYKERKCIKSLSLIDAPSNDGTYTEEELVNSFISKLRCNRKKAESLFLKLLKLGLREESLSLEVLPLRYDLRKFALTRRYVSFADYAKFLEKMSSYDE